MILFSYLRNIFYSSIYDYKWLAVKSSAFLDEIKLNEYICIYICMVTIHNSVNVSRN